MLHTAREKEYAPIELSHAPCETFEPPRILHTARVKLLSAQIFLPMPREKEYMRLLKFHTLRVQYSSRPECLTRAV